MCSLHGFPAFPPVGHISLCEVEGRVHSMHAEQADVLLFTNAVASHPRITITRDLLHSSVCREDSRRIFLPVSETLFKKLTNVWYEQGLVEALHVTAEPQDGREVPVVLQVIAAYMLRVISGMNYIRNSFHPHLRESGDKLIAAVSQTRAWPISPVRCLAWHPHCTKLAVAAWDDSVRVYSPGTSITPILKCKSQRAVSCMAWRPFSASQLAVGCEEGVFVWHVDPNSVVTRPSMSCATVLKRPHHSPVTSVTWNPQGDVLLTASAADTAMYVWDVAMEKFVTLRRVGGGGVSLVTWSPDGSKVFAATTGIIFRVWGTSQWLPERWTVVSGHVQAACWSPCGSVLLFATSEEPLIYSLTFSKVDTAFQGDNTSKTALPIVDLTEVEVNEGERVGGVVVSLMWDTRGQHLAVMFKKTDLVAIFLTELHALLQVSPCCLVQGVSGEIPNCISFQQNFGDGACLTIAWSSGRVQYFPLVHSDLKSERNIFQETAISPDCSLQNISLASTFRTM
ncbi:aladin-like isoform X2 [Zootermopsis nevadensis]|nr:aladin-like isoform X2 [Zootermopsis nevadensis]